MNNLVQNAYNFINQRPEIRKFMIEFNENDSFMLSKSPYIGEIYKAVEDDTHSNASFGCMFCTNNHCLGLIQLKAPLGGAPPPHVSGSCNSSGFVRCCIGLPRFRSNYRAIEPTRWTQSCLEPKVAIRADCRAEGTRVGVFISTV